MDRVVVYVPQELHTKLKTKLGQRGHTVSYWFRSKASEEVSGVVTSGISKVELVDKIRKSAENPIFGVPDEIEEEPRLKRKCSWNKVIGGQVFHCQYDALPGSSLCKNHQVDA